MATSDSLRGLNVEILEYFNIKGCDRIGKSFFSKFLKAWHLKFIGLNLSEIQDIIEGVVFSSILEKSALTLKMLIFKSGSLINTNS